MATASTVVKKQDREAVNASKVEGANRALEITFSEIDKRFGKGAIMLLGDRPMEQIEVVSTGSINLDLALGVNGFPRGRVIEIFGPEASGKTTLTLHAIAEVQKNGGVCAFVDAEHALDSSYAARLGVKVENLIISQPDYGEQALEIAEMLIRSGAVDMLVIDSVAALVPKAELEGEMGDSHMGLQARLMSQALRKLTPVVHKSKTVLIFINQIRQKIGAMAFGNKETTTGGNALKFYASVRLDVRRIGSIKKDERQIGNRVLVKVVKNKVAPPFTRTEFDIMFDSGITPEREVLEIAIADGWVKQSGAWFSVDGERLAQGKESCVQKLREDRALYAKLYEKVKTSGTVRREQFADDEDKKDDEL